MLKGLGNIAALMKQAQTMGPRMQEINEKLKTDRVSGTAGAGMVTVHVDGLGSVLSVDIDQVLIDKGDFEMVKDLLPAAINQAVAKANELKVEQMGSLTGDIELPAGLDDMMKKFMGPTDE